MNTQKRYFGMGVAVLVIALIIGSMLFSSCGYKRFPQGATAAGPKNVIFYIGDGMASVQRRIPEEVHGRKLAINSLPIVGIYTTYASNTIVTDSAAAGTAMATGHKTDTLVVGMNPKKTIAYETLAEAAKRLGKSVGILTTTRITHATPACFGSHIGHRDKENEIAEQYLDQDFEVWMGGGWRHFVPKSVKGSKRKDERDLLKEFTGKGYTLLRSKSDLNNLKIEKDTKIFGVFYGSHMPYYVDREDNYYQGKVPNLSDMVNVAIRVLKQNPKGFFLMVEGGRIDHAAHGNDPVGVVSETIDLDNAVKVGIEFSKEDSDTLIIVGGDHETGGMGMGIGGMKGDTYHGYFMSPEVIKNAKRSVEFMGYTAVYGKPDEAIKLFTKFTGISDFSEGEIKEIEKAVEYTKAKKGMASPNPSAAPWFSVAFANILSKRARVGWTSYAHTGHPVLLTGIGPGSENFAGSYDNTDLANKMASLWGITLKTWPVKTVKKMELQEDEKAYQVGNLPIVLKPASVGDEKVATVNLSLSGVVSAKILVAGFDIDGVEETKMYVNDEEVELPDDIIADMKTVIVAIDLDLDILEEGENEIRFAFNEAVGGTNGFEIHDVKIITRKGNK